LAFPKIKSRRPNDFLNVTKDGFPIREAYLKRPKAKIGVGTFVKGVIPPYEEHVVRVEAGYTLRAWARLTDDEQALEVALFRMKGLVEAHYNQK
jgi:hypothetical protein